MESSKRSNTLPYTLIACSFIVLLIIISTFVSSGEFLIGPAVILLVFAIKIIPETFKSPQRKKDDWFKFLGYFEGDGKLEHDGINVSVSHGRLRGAGYSSHTGYDRHFVVEAPLKINEGGKLHIYKKSFITFNFIKQFGAKKVRTGNADFDSKYIIESDDERFVRGVLTREIQNKLLELGKNFVPRLYAADGMVSFAVIEKKPQNKEQYDRIVSIALMIFSRIKDFFPSCDSENVSIKEQDRVNIIKVIGDLAIVVLKGFVIILIGLVLVCYLVMRFTG